METGNHPGLAAAVPLPSCQLADCPGLCLDYFQSVLRGAWALVQPARHGWGQDVGVPRRGWLRVRVPWLLPHQGRQLAGPAPGLHRRPRLERRHLQRALRTGGDTRAQLPGCCWSLTHVTSAEHLLHAWLCARPERDRLLLSHSFYFFSSPNRIFKKLQWKHFVSRMLTEIVLRGPA